MASASPGGLAGLGEGRRVGHLAAWHAEFGSVGCRICRAWEAGLTYPVFQLEVVGAARRALSWCSRRVAGSASWAPSWKYSGLASRVDSATPRAGSRIGTRQRGTPNSSVGAAELPGLGGVGWRSPSSSWKDSARRVSPAPLARGGAVLQTPRPSSAPGWSCPAGRGPRAGRGGPAKPVFQLAVLASPMPPHNIIKP